MGRLVSGPLATLQALGYILLKSEWLQSSQIDFAKISALSFKNLPETLCRGLLEISKFHYYQHVIKT